MEETKNYRRFDWEAIEFPLKLTGITSVTNHYNIPFDTVLTIYRNENYRLKGTIQGVTTNPEDLEYKEDGKLKPVGFIKDETLKATSKNYDYILTGFDISHTNEIPYRQEGGVAFQFDCQISIDGIELVNKDKQSPDLICDYFMGSLPRLLFNNITRRIKNTGQYKFRDTFDNYDESNEDYRKGHSSSWDFCILNYGEEKIIVQCVHENHLPKNIDGLLIEYRNASSGYVTKRLRKIVQEYLSFILGTHLQKVGSSKFSYGYKLITGKSNNPWSRRIDKNGNINPVPLKNGLDRDFFDKMLNRLFAEFLIQYDRILLSDCLWKLWIGHSLPLGTNLPILSSGLETLIDSYLELNNLIPTYSKDQKTQYSSLVKDEITVLELKLEGFAFKDAIINKLKNPYNISGGEKMKIFFAHIALNFDKKSLENQALMARNLMTHQKLNFDTEEERQRIKKISDAYVSLINRVILKLLGYDWYYIDYSKEGVHYLRMDENL